MTRYILRTNKQKRKWDETKLNWYHLYHSKKRERETKKNAFKNDKMVYFDGKKKLDGPEILICSLLILLVTLTWHDYYMIDNNNKPKKKCRLWDKKQTQIANWNVLKCNHLIMKRFRIKIWWWWWRRSNYSFIHSYTTTTTNTGGHTIYLKPNQIHNK